MAKVLVRVTLFAEPIEVDEDELPGLRSQGLLIEDEAGSEPSAPARRSRRSGQNDAGQDGSQNDAGSGTTE